MALFILAWESEIVFDDQHCDPYQKFRGKEEMEENFEY